MAAAPLSATIFVVDDDEGLSRLIQKTLQREGFTVAAALSGREAIAWLQKNRADLMLLDLKLHDFQGKDLLNQLPNAQHSVPFIVITGQGDERVAVEMMKCGALDYLVKDVDFLQFIPQVIRRALDQLEKDKQLLQLQKQVLEISEREQRRIGQDLHDGLGQQLTAIELMCQALKSNPGLTADHKRLEKALDNLSLHIRSAITQTRTLAHGLAPFKVESGGLETALAELAQTTSASGHTTCQFDCPSPVTVSAPEIATHLYRIAQEAVNNALKHGHPKQLRIELLRQNGNLRLQISDNGKGFVSANDQGVGLRVMNHRAAVIGAELRVESKPRKGVTVTCVLPLQD
jgi:signal transduction histidine kinase